MNEFDRLKQIIARLRGEDGCPWDREQTHVSLKPACMEEAAEEGLFTLEDVCRGISEKMVRRHPHVFGRETVNQSGEVVTRWNDIKKAEKAGKEWTDDYLPEAFEEAKALIDAAKRRKGFE